MPINYTHTKNGVVGFSQKNYQTKRHCHFFIEVAFSLTGSLNIKTDNHEYNHIKSVIINSNIPHTFDCLRDECQLYFFDPTSFIGNQIMKDYLGGHKEIVVNELTSVDFFQENYLSIAQEQQIVLKDKDERINVCLEWIESNYSLESINISKLSEIALLSAIKYFKKRHQKIEIWHFNTPKISIDIHYRATLAMDLPNGMKIGDTLELKGRTEFVIENEKIKTIRDYSYD